jgi:hypothetical protein
LKSSSNTSCCTNGGDIEHCVIDGEKGEDKIEDESGDNGRLCDDDCEVDAEKEVFIID